MAAQRTSQAQPKYVFWQEDGGLVGYLEDYPDYWTQGETPQELEENLRDLLADLSSGEIPHARHLATLPPG